MRNKVSIYQRWNFPSAAVFAFLCALCIVPSNAENGLKGTQPDWVIAAWESRDRVDEVGYAAAAEKIADRLGEKANPALKNLAKSTNGAETARETYIRLAQMQRKELLSPYLDRIKKVVFTEHNIMGGRSHYAYTEGLTDHPESPMGDKGGGLYLLTIDEDANCSVEALLEVPQGILRDPDVSFDGERILFSKRDSKHEDYHLFEMTISDRSVRRITFGEAHADIEPAYLPNGGIVFNSTRCVQDVDCFPKPVSNFFLCDIDGRFIRRIGFDQVHTNYPTLMSDGLVLYTRWEYNDRKQYQTQCLFKMNPDGTNQQEYFGNNSPFPTSILHAREIPGSSGKAVAILSGHHTDQQGYLAIIDPSKGDDGLQSVQLIAPERQVVDPGPKGSDRDFYGQTGDVYQYPYPLDENSFLAAHRYIGEGKNQPQFDLVFVTRDGTREILAQPKTISCGQPIPLASREKPPVLSSRVDYRKKQGDFSIVDVYHGESSEGIARGTIERIRVVGIEYRARSFKPTAAGDSYTPVAVGSGTWDVKVIVGEAEVYEDGSAWFTAPARMPLYFQLVDTNGFVAQTMRSWTTLQPGEGQSCVGCHEKKDEIPAPKTTIAQSRGPKPLNEFYGPMRGFSFDKEIQPILDEKCIRCHDGGVHDGATTIDFRAIKPPEEDFTYYWGQKRRGGMESTPQYGSRNSSKSYWNMLAYVSWLNALGPAYLLPPYEDGAFKSDIIKHLDQGHNDIQLTKEERDKFCCWIDLIVPYAGDYMEDMWEEETAIYQHWLDKRNAWLEIENQNILDYLEYEQTSILLPERSRQSPFDPGPIQFTDVPQKQAKVYVVDVRGRLIPQSTATSVSKLRIPASGIYLRKDGRKRVGKTVLIDE